MTQRQVVKAYQVLESLSKQAMPVKAAYAVHKLRRKLKPAFDFQLESEEKLVKRLKPEFKDGLAQFATTDDAHEWNDELMAVAEMESDIEFEPISITMTDDMRISPDEIDALEGFVEFSE